MKIFNFLSTLFGNKDFISQESPILADFKNTILKYDIFEGINTFIDLIGKSIFQLF